MHVKNVIAHIILLYYWKHLDIFYNVCVNNYYKQKSDNTGNTEKKKIYQNLTEQ